MAKEATNPKPNVQREWYCLAVHNLLSSFSYKTLN